MTTLMQYFVILATIATIISAGCMALSLRLIRRDGLHHLPGLRILLVGLLVTDVYLVFLDLAYGLGLSMEAWQFLRRSTGRLMLMVAQVGFVVDLFWPRRPRV